MTLKNKTKENTTWKSWRVKLTIRHIQETFMTSLDAINCTMYVICYETQILPWKYELHVCLLIFSSILEHKRFFSWIPLCNFVLNPNKNEWEYLICWTDDVCCWVFLWLSLTRIIFRSLEFFKRMYRTHLILLVQLHYGNWNIEGRNIIC